MNKYLKMVLPGLCLLCSLSASNAQNVANDGGFEAGNLNSYWAPSGNVAIDSNNAQHYDGSYSAIFNSDGGGATGSLSQTMTLPSTDAPYWLYFHYGAFGSGKGQALRYVVSSNGTTLATGVISASPSFLLYGQLFHSSSASVTVSFYDASSSASAAGGVLDAVSVVPMPAFNLPGKYSGTETRTISFSNTDVTQKETRRISARISAFGEILMVEQPGDTYAVHAIFNDGGVRILVPNGAGYVSTALINGSSISYTYNHTIGALENGRPVTLSNSYSLRRVGN